MFVPITLGVRELQQVHRRDGHDQEDEGGLPQHGGRNGQAGRQDANHHVLVGKSFGRTQKSEEKSR